MNAARRWHDYWLAPEAPQNLAVCRMLFYGMVLCLYATVPFSGWGALLRGTSFYQPVSFLKLLHLKVLSDPALGAIGWAWKCSMLLACIGLFTRASTIVAFAAGAYLLAVQNSDGKVEHQTAMLVFVLGILALSRCGDALSVDALLCRRKTTLLPSGEYRWPVRAVWVLMSLAFFAAGTAKLRNTHAAHHTGLDWATGEGFSLLLIERFYDPNPPRVAWGLFIANHALLARLMAGGSLAVEVFFPLALFSRRLRFILPSAAFMMQIGIGLFMSIWFLQYLPVYIFWAPWGRLIGRANHTS